MRVIKAEFEPLRDVSVDRLFGATGVYVLWTGRAVFRPTYVGEGYLLDRFSQHAIRFGDALVGCLAILGYESTQKIKDEAQIIEHLLLDVAKQIDRFPIQNKSRGVAAGVKDMFNRHGVLRVHLGGIDPLRDPTIPSSRLAMSKVIELRRTREGVIDVVHDWNKRTAGR